jgi:hypothetical protein
VKLVFAAPDSFLSAAILSHVAAPLPDFAQVLRLEPDHLASAIHLATKAMIALPDDDASRRRIS